MRTAAFLLAISAVASPQEIVLKNGNTLEWRVLKDAGDAYEVQTSDNRSVTIAKKDVKEIKTTVPKAPLTGAAFVGDETKGLQAQNILALVDPKKHAAGGDVRIAAGALVCSGSGLLEIPYIPVGAYDVEVVVERRDGTDELHLGLVASGNPFSIQMDWGKGTCSGISTISGKNVFENETRTNGAVFVARKPRVILAAVRDGEVVVLLDGKEHLRWKGDVKALSLGTRPPKMQNLFLQWNESSFAISRYVVTPRR